MLEEFRRTNSGTGFGLAGMRERVREIGGRLEITSDVSGTRVQVVVPIEVVQEFKQPSRPSFPEEPGTVENVTDTPPRSKVEGMLFGHA
jgi:hypothetical protein